jgi:oligopeptide/dipeptide ABC transporter ATP-binding protein
MVDEMLIEARGLVKTYPLRRGVTGKGPMVIKAVDGISIAVRRGEAVGLVGESGCGKTTVGRCLLRLTDATEGQVYWKMPAEARQRMIALETAPISMGNNLRKGRNVGGGMEHIDREYSLQKKSSEALRLIRREMQIVFQDPSSSLNPRMVVRDIIGEPFKIHKMAKGEAKASMILDLLDRVGLSSEHLDRFPHELSGGQKQRVGIARALALNPEFIVLDEPTSALDVSVQAQILNLLSDLRSRSGLTYLLISHDLSIIRHMCDRVYVMYMGTIVESATCADLFMNPLHPYTEALLSSIPGLDPERRRKAPLSGEPPSTSSFPPGCRFHPRCKHREAICEGTAPSLIDIGGGHSVACHFRR